MDNLLSVSFVSLHSNFPKDGGNNELLGGQYKRIDTSLLFSQSENGKAILMSDILFKKLPTSSISHLGIWDAEKNGNFLISIALEQKKEVYDGDSFTVPANELVLSID